MYLRQQFKLIQNSGILFAFNVSPAITENIIRLAVYMVILNPGYYGGEWLKEFIYQVKAQYDLHYDSTDQPLEVIYQFIENIENKGIRSHFYMQISRLIREVLNHDQLRDVVKGFFNDLFDSEGHDAVLHISLNVGKGLLSAPEKFDLFYWLKRLIDQGPEDIKDETYESLHQIARERSFHIYDILGAICTWLPDKNKEPDGLTYSNKYALIFIVDKVPGELFSVLRTYLNAFGEEYETGFLSPIGLFVISDIVIWNLFVFCNLYFVIFSNLAIFRQNFTTRNQPLDNIPTFQRTDPFFPFTDC